jgi:hypothetical protein
VYDGGRIVTNHISGNSSACSQKAQTSLGRRRMRRSARRASNAAASSSIAAWKNSTGAIFVGERNEDRSLGDLRLTTWSVGPGLSLETWLFVEARVVGKPSLTGIMEELPVTRE